MSKSKRPLSPKLTVKPPVSLLFKPVKVDFKDLFKALAKGVGHTATGKWIELGGDSVEALAALGLRGPEISRSFATQWQRTDCSRTFSAPM